MKHHCKTQISTILQWNKVKGSPVIWSDKETTSWTMMGPATNWSISDDLLRRSTFCIWWKFWDNFLQFSKETYVVCVLIRSTLVRHFWVPTTYVFMEKLEINYPIIKYSSFIRQSSAILLPVVMSKNSFMNGSKYRPWSDDTFCSSCSWSALFVQTSVSHYLSFYGA